jgi:ankyrin repeat protein
VLLYIIVCRNMVLSAEEIGDINFVLNKIGNRGDVSHVDSTIVIPILNELMGVTLQCLGAIRLVTRGGTGCDKNESVVALMRTFQYATDSMMNSVFPGRNASFSAGSDKIQTESGTVSVNNQHRKVYASVLKHLVLQYPLRSNQLHANPRGGSLMFPLSAASPASPTSPSSSSPSSFALKPSYWLQMHWFVLSTSNREIYEKYYSEGFLQSGKQSVMEMLYQSISGSTKIGDKYGFGPVHYAILAGLVTTENSEFFEELLQQFKSSSATATVPVSNVTSNIDISSPFALPDNSNGFNAGNVSMAPTPQCTQLLHLTARYSQNAAMVEQIRSFFPKCALETDEMGNYPMHVAALYNASPQMMKSILQTVKYPSLLLSKPNYIGRLPLHLAASGYAMTIQKHISAVETATDEVENRCTEILMMLASAYPTAFKTPDVFGLLPLHIASFHNGSARIVNYILAQCPMAVKYAVRLTSSNSVMGPSDSLLGSDLDENSVLGAGSVDAHDDWKEHFSPANAEKKIVTSPSSSGTGRPPLMSRRSHHQASRILDWSVVVDADFDKYTSAGSGIITTFLGLLGATPVGRAVGEEAASGDDHRTERSIPKVSFDLPKIPDHSSVFSFSNTSSLEPFDAIDRPNDAVPDARPSSVAGGQDGQSSASKVSKFTRVSSEDMAAAFESGSADAFGKVSSIEFGVTEVQALFDDRNSDEEDDLRKMDEAGGGVIQDQVHLRRVRITPGPSKDSGSTKQQTQQQQQHVTRTKHDVHEASSGGSWNDYLSSLWRSQVEVGRRQHWQDADDNGSRATTRVTNTQRTNSRINSSIQSRSTGTPTSAAREPSYSTPSKYSSPHGTRESPMAIRGSGGSGSNRNVFSPSTMAANFYTSASIGGRSSPSASTTTLKTNSYDSTGSASSSQQFFQLLQQRLVEQLGICDGMLPLHLAAMNCHIADDGQVMINILRTYPFAAQVTDCKGQFPLHYLVDGKKYFQMTAVSSQESSHGHFFITRRHFRSRLNCLYALVKAFPDAVFSANQDMMSPYDIVKENYHKFGVASLNQSRSASTLGGDSDSDSDEEQNQTPNDDDTLDSISLAGAKSSQREKNWVTMTMAGFQFNKDANSKLRLVPTSAGASSAGDVSSFGRGLETEYELVMRVLLNSDSSNQDIEMRRALNWKARRAACYLASPRTMFRDSYDVYADAAEVDGAPRTNRILSYAVVETGRDIWFFNIAAYTSLVRAVVEMHEEEISSQLEVQGSESLPAKKSVWMQVVSFL